MSRHNALIRMVSRAEKGEEGCNNPMEINPYEIVFSYAYSHIREE